MRAFVKASEIQKIDQDVMRESRISSFELMAHVSEEMSEVLLDRFPEISTKFHILCGPGNNGGDGYSLARFLLAAGRDVSVETLMKPQSDDAKKAMSLLPKDVFTRPSDSRAVLIDAIFGAQGRSDLPEAVADALARFRKWKGFCVSLDLPTPGFIADLTITVAYPKVSFLEAKNLEAVGELTYVGKDFPTRSLNLMAIEPSDFRLPPRKRGAHKGDFGRLAVVGGDPSMPGAAVLAAEAGARMGAGYASLFFAKKAKNLKLSVQHASFLYHSVWSMKNLARETALVIGCGGRPPAFFSYAALKIPAVIDASALSEAKAAEIAIWKKSKTPLLLTPHPKEAAALLKTTVKEVEGDRFGALEDLVKLTGQSVYLKGVPGLLKFRGDPKTYVNLLANPSFATAGSGDVLAGILGGILAQGSLGFEESVISGLAFQQSVGRVLQILEGSISSDQLECFNQAFKFLRGI